LRRRRYTASAGGQQYAEQRNQSNDRGDNLLGFAKIIHLSPLAMNEKRLLLYWILFT
jgi:hypothetical protein